jgi:hypothetical protein
MINPTAAGTPIAAILIGEILLPEDSVAVEEATWSAAVPVATVVPFTVSIEAR